MSLYFSLILVGAVGLILRMRYGAAVIPYAAAGLFLVLFLYCPTRFHHGLGSWTAPEATTLGTQVDRIAEVVSFGMLFLAAWIFSTTRRKDTG